MKSTRTVLATLRAFESRNVTFVAPDGRWPIVWERARGVHVWDLEGRRYLDLTAAFGVAAAGHANPRVVAAGQSQMARLLHAMGDVHPHRLKARLAEELSRLTFERWTKQTIERRALDSQPSTPNSLDSGTLAASSSVPRSARVTGKVIFGNSGFEAVEAALKTALLATGRPGVIAFEGAYHGLGYGALTATERAHFRLPFRAQLKPFVRFAPFPMSSVAMDPACAVVRRELAEGRCGAVLIEPVQGRGGIRVPPPGFLAELRRLCDAVGALLIVDEIYTGFGRTGRWFACEHSGVIPDLICLGKALTGGFPLSACVGRAEVMDRAWPEATGEAIHTSTFLGHPVGCAMALAQLREIASHRLVARSERSGTALRAQLLRLRVPAGFVAEVRGLGLMVGLELRHRNGQPAAEAVLRLVQVMLEHGFILLPEGEPGNVVGFTPPLTMTETDLRRTVRALEQALEEVTKL
jgi:4-aminobutyrate aminotransferase-like enzyme